MRAAYQYLLSERNATLISNAVAVTLTLALPRVYVLLKCAITGLLTLHRLVGQRMTQTRLRGASKVFFEKVLASFGRSPSKIGLNMAPLEVTSSTQSEGDREMRILVGTLETIQGSTTAEDAVSRLVRRHLAMPRLVIGNGVFCLRRMVENVRDEPGASGQILVVIVLLFAIYVGLQVTAISSGFIIGDSAAPIKEGTCAYYVTAGHHWEKHGSGADHGYLNSLADSTIGYTRACYHSTVFTNPCSRTLTRTIFHNISSGSTCPFLNKAMCKNGDSSVSTMDLGFVDANSLGINSARKFDFRRRTTCSPVLDNDSFVQSHIVSENVAEISYSYQSTTTYRTPPYTFRERRYLNYYDLPNGSSRVSARIPDVLLSKAYDVQ